MTINQINTVGALPPSSPPLSTSRKLSTSNADVVVSPVSTADPRVNSSPRSEDQVNEAVQKIQGTVDNLAHNLRFSIDEDTGKTIIKVMDVHTEEIIRQIPSEEAVEIARTLDKVQGLLFNGKA
ncbi:flagellar protein FlaG [Nitrosomonas oligotropha]|uniref:Flagellar protein FlaG n=1 Tax=Nitrosomonas oligotropha TaxID=42354 RepID=A0A1H8PGG7_9PROT|nr:flagellar protein FlaG [Nitrosomonas oligotropha]SDW78358.1 flagellar protein FlaG [Nitrosomonas oligotropha]SEO41020.1 flagellar protein FlaG [Nitrosomonas oligotropha]